MAARAIIVSLLCSISLIILYSVDMPSSPANGQDLKVRLSASSSAVKVTIENESPTTVYSLLTWNTPLDPQAMNIGTLTLEDVETGAIIPGPDMKINRKLPAPRDALVEILPQSIISRDVSLTFPWIPNDGRVCRMRVRGSWNAVWAKPAAQVTDEELSTMTGDGHVSKDIIGESVELRLAR